MSTCPCCSNILLRHLNARNVTWFCSHCRQEMPILSLNKSNILQLAPSSSKIKSIRK